MGHRSKVKTTCDLTSFQYAYCVSTAATVGTKLHSQVHHMLEISSHVGQGTNERVLSIFKQSMLDFACWTEVFPPCCFNVHKRKNQNPDWSRDQHRLTCVLQQRQVRPVSSVSSQSWFYSAERPGLSPSKRQRQQKTWTGGPGTLTHVSATVFRLLCVLCWSICLGFQPF